MIGGASQFAAVQLMTENAPLLVVVVTALAVNMRMAMYSASLAPHLGKAPLWKRAIVAYLNVDQTFAMAHGKYEAEPELTLAERLVYFFGTATPVAPMWYLMTLLGALMGQRIPTDWSIDFAVPITFLAIIAPLLKTLAHMLAAMTSVVVALALWWMPYNTGLLVAALVAMGVGATTETLMARGRR